MTTYPSWLHPIQLPMPAGLGAAVVYLIHSSKSAALIDTGLKEPSSRGLLEAGLRERGLRLNDVEWVVLTHYHVDHTGLAADLQSQGAKVAMTRRDAEILNGFAKNEANDAARVAMFAGHPVPKSMSDGVTKMFAFMRRLGDAVEPDTLVSEGDELILAGRRFCVLETPGHTPGHLALKDLESGALFTGDTILSPSRTHMQGNAGGDGGDPFADYCRTLRILETVSGAVAYPGHGKPVTDVAGCSLEILAHLQSELEATYQKLTDSPLPAMALTLEKQNGRVRPFPKWLALSQTVGYLTHLVGQGRAVLEETEEGICYRQGSASRPTVQTEP